MFDLGVVLFSLFFGLKGLIGGFVLELINFIGLLGGIFVASRVAKPISSSIQGFFTTSNLALIEAILFFVILGLFLLVGKVISKYLLKDEQEISTWHRVGGYFVAVLKYFVIFSILITILSNTPKIQKKIEAITVDSRVYSYMLDCGKLFLNKK